jgi:hypothetical protein
MSRLFSLTVRGMKAAKFVGLLSQTPSRSRGALAYNVFANSRAFSRNKSAAFFIFSSWLIPGRAF